MPAKTKKTSAGAKSDKHTAEDHKKSTAATLPNWPVLRPVMSASDISLETLLPDQIMTIPRLWTANLCKTYVAFLSTLSLTTTPGKPKKGEAVRVNDRFQVYDHDFAEKLWSSTALKELLEKSVIDGRDPLTDGEKSALWGGELLGLNDNIRIYRYTKGQFFDRHYDDSNEVLFPSSSVEQPVPSRTTWTLLLYLSSPMTGCQGGETVFYPEAMSKRSAAPLPVVAEPEVGMMLLHRHGKECLLHEGREVTAGEKWIIRSDLCVKR